MDPGLNSNFTNSSWDDSCMYSVATHIKFYRFVTNGILLNFFGCLGILGNIISMIILSRPQMRSSINCLLIGLARIDTLLIITSILLFGLPGIFPYSGFLFNYYYYVYAHIAPVVYPLGMMAQTASVYITVTVSLERFVAVCHPLKARALCTYGRARAYVIGIIIFSIAYNMPRLWESNIQQDFYEKMNVTVYSNKERQLLSRLQKREIGLATMLLCVVLVFFICNLLPLVINIIEIFELDPDIDLGMMIFTSNLLVTINSSVNFIIYVIFGEKFKRLFLVLFCHNSLFNSGRDSPDMHDTSFISNGDRITKLTLKSPLKKQGNNKQEKTFFGYLSDLFVRRRQQDKRPIEERKAELLSGQQIWQGDNSIHDANVHSRIRITASNAAARTKGDVSVLISLCGVTQTDTSSLRWQLRSGNKGTLHG
ncbi:unnamed protein product [Brassicogethes aeneus]|uniref:G-protein coupled receptors family 1 profile domain-containing protein n=1 Tax=Brassicogethes aeneus TaxID=1431903 RepID=A0A9P0FJL3_BRAAE|nr:unnamed protein product [Brassicogethes aeneus]